MSKFSVYSNNARTEDDLKESFQCVVSSVSPVEFRRAMNSMSVGYDACLRETRNFPAPTLHVDIKIFNINRNILK
jgi:hypothetical protein